MKKTWLLLVLMPIIIGCTQSTTPKASTETSESLEIPECVVTSPPDSLQLDPFYKKYVDVNGIPLISSWRVPDSCFVAAHRTLYAMTSMLSPEIMAAMRKAKARVGIMARYEGTTDIPEHHYLVNDTALNWDLRARGLGGDLNEPLTTCAEENILAYQIDKYHAEDILIHEFAHAIHLIGILQTEPDINERLEKLQADAKAKGLWKNTYAETDIMEYFAEAVQDWFNVNAEMDHPDGKHNWVNTREELKEYDPEMFKLLSRYFPETNLQISKHKKVNIHHKPIDH